jgi:hypothetical protein
MTRIRMGMLGVVVALVGLGACGSSAGSPDSGASDGAGTAGTSGAGGQAGGGGAGGAPASSGVSGTKRLDALTTAEKQKICDFAAAHFGGYGQSIDCGGGVTLSADASQAMCVSMAPTSCAFTVSQYETCISAASCSDPLPAACGPLLQCS